MERNNQKVNRKLKKTLEKKDKERREETKCQWGKEQKGVGEVKPLESLIRLHFYVIPK